LVSGGEKKLQKKSRRRFAYGDASIGVCGLCNLCDHAEPRPEADVKLVDGQRNVESTIAISERKVVFKELFPAEKHMHELPKIVLSEKPTTPEEELKRTGLIFEGFKSPSAELTVGDLSLEAKHRAQDGKRFLKNIEQDLSVGALTGMDEDKRDLDELYSGPKAPQPSMSETQSIDAERYREQKRKAVEQLRLRSLLVGGRDERLEEYTEKYLKGKPKEKV
jgi:hypothetical protein